MKNTFKLYAIVWSILLVVYNLVVFLVKPILPGYVFNYDARFCIAWGIIIATYIGQIFCAKIAFDPKNRDKLFLNIPLIKQSYTSLIAVTVICSILMLIPDLPAWIAAIVCVIVLVLCVLPIIKSKSAADIVSETDVKVKTKTFFIKSLTVDADTLMASAKSDAVKAECRKVYEAIRYSDPMSNDALSSVESSITIEFAKLTEAVKEDNAERVAELVNEVVILVGDRNKKCKLLK